MSTCAQHGSSLRATGGGGSSEGGGRPRRRGGLPPEREGGSDRSVLGTRAADAGAAGNRRRSRTGDQLLAGSRLAGSRFWKLVFNLENRLPVLS